MGQYAIEKSRYGTLFSGGLQLMEQADKTTDFNSDTVVEVGTGRWWVYLLVHSFDNDAHDATLDVAVTANPETDFSGDDAQLGAFSRIAGSADLADELYCLGVVSEQRCLRLEAVMGGNAAGRSADLEAWIVPAE